MSQSVEDPTAVANQKLGEAANRLTASEPDAMEIADLIGDARRALDQSDHHDALTHIQAARDHTDLSQQSERRALREAISNARLELEADE